jgi:hypothetical protein
LQANPADLFDESGKLKPVSELPRDLAASIRSVKLDKNGEVVGIDLVDRVAVANALLRSMGVGESSITANAASGVVMTGEVSADERLRALSALVARLKERQALPRAVK